MSYDSLLIHTVDLISKTVGKWNKATETTESDVTCRIMRRVQIIKNNRGEEIASYAKIFFKASQTIGETTRIKIDGREHPVIKIDKPSDSIAIHHVEVWVS